MPLYKRLLKLSLTHYRKFVLAALCMGVVGATTGAMAYLMQPVFDDVFLHKDGRALIWIAVTVILLFFLKGAASYGQTLLMSLIGQRVITDMRNDLYRKILCQPLSFFTKNPTGTLISRITNDVMLIQGAVSEAVTSIVKDTFSVIGLVFVVFYQDWKLAIIAMVVFPLTGYPISRFSRKMRQIATRTQVTMGTLTALLQETISGNRIVKAFGMEEHENKKFSVENERLFKLTMKSVSVRAVSSPLMEFFGGFGIAAVIFYGGSQVVRGASTPGTFISFITALLMLYEPIKRLTNVNNTIQQGIAGAQRVFEVIDTIPEIQDRKGAVTLPRISQKIALRGVSFRYEDEFVLKNIDLTIRAGEVVAFVGMSGGGKTTLVNLIPRFYDVTEGAIEIDGVDIRNVTMASLRAQIGIVTQQTILFNDTVRNNIAYGDVTKGEAAIIAAAKAANSHDFIMKLPMGYDTIIGESGLKLSGGERQRISIARALLKDAPILILDEATSSLDTEAEIEVQEALDKLMRNRTTLVIAHRLSTIRNADRIIALVGGRIVEEGNHDTLLAKQGEYYKLYNLQFKNDNGGRQ